MNKQEIIDILRTSEASFLATVENGEPRVRGMAHYIAADGRILYHSGKNKDLARQVEGNPVAELCVFNHQSMTQVRVRGIAKILDDKALADEIMEARPFLKEIVNAIGIDTLLLFEITQPKATVWTMAENFAPKEWVEI